MATSRPDGRTALVTGGSRGIGKAVSLRLAREGVLVAVHYGHDDEAAQATVKEIEAGGGRALAVRAELGVPGDADAVWDGFDRGLVALGAEPGVDIVVNNAGITLPRHLADVTEEDYDRVFAVNTRAPFFVLQRALPRLRDGGRIVNISSAASRVAYPPLVAYAMSKGALDTLTLALAAQLGPRGITVNTVAPGFTDTGINPTLADPQIRRALAAASVFDRLGTPADIADAVAFLAGGDGRWITGHWLDATGGVRLGH
ncbi:SDR family oxidoreductase [Streptomyces cocklensis]|jgi:NAD(P)-dependent dehydrogenase (short-subunit alcohol dehydrogenase family)|uniref:Short-chain dehydrogenase n=1 Tax=Actinacidiphila cocklensis TaxID=887465 RepID=A0A9W4E3D7_9ACTN|nr:SDR family oxidoreductase [Actinacidiphila cocklensis]MDD1062040.1 SDR family oxidoreductase [Actinacidiphila cocklensis]WSX74781.1 SDR family oxidoreductase [Streptomyces sp. NBC_00899]CAG6398707.1 Short-chain dehydrogenase [Actinacidiphila cocklensis]